MKKKKSGASKSEQLRALREKNAADAEKSAKVAKGKKSKAAKPAKAPAPKKQKSTALVPAKLTETDEKLQTAAIENESRLKELIPQHVVRGVEIYNIMQDHQTRELWKYGETPYKSWTAFVEHYAKMADISKRTLQAVISSNKALPGVSAEVKKKIGARKLKRVVAAVKKHRQKTGDPNAAPPAEIIDAAIEQPEREFEATLEKAGLAPEPEVVQSPAEVTRQMFDYSSAGPVSTEPEPAIGETVGPVSTGEDVVWSGEGTAANVEEAEEMRQTIQQAIDTAKELYEVEGNPLVFICKQFLAAQYSGPHEHLHDTTNAAAYHELFGKPKNGKKGKRK